MPGLNGWRHAVLEKERMMIVKFHPRGRGGGGGPVDYLLGKDRQRDGASVLQGSGRSPGAYRRVALRQKVHFRRSVFCRTGFTARPARKADGEFERVLMPGLDKDQYSVLWVGPGQGAAGAELPDPEHGALTGKRLQPYDRADRPRIDAWQTIVNGRLGLHDPNAPENRRVLVSPSALPEAKQEAAQAITSGLLALASSGELKTRQDVTEALESAGFEVVRTTKSSISIADPDGGETSD
jgi:hypothetical protein